MDDQKKRMPEDVPDYFGTGRRPRGDSSHGTLTLVLLLVLLGANLVTVGTFLGRQSRESRRESPEQSREVIASLKEEELPHRQTAAAAPPGGIVLNREELFRQVSRGLTRVVAQSPGYARKGLGVVLTADGYILTNAHTVRDADALTVTLSDGREKTALFVGADEETDLAVLRVEEKNLSPAATGSTAGNESFYVFTDPEEEMTSADARALTQSSFQGVAVNTVGQVVYFGRETGSPLSMEEAGNLAYDLICYGCINRRDFFGLQVSDPEEVERRYWRLPQGVLVDQAAVNGSGYQAGLRQGDLITEVNGQTVTGVEEFYQAARDCQGPVSVEFFRKGEKYRVEITP